jgi:hypothetical protein
MPVFEQQNSHREPQNWSLLDTIMICLSLKWPYGAMIGNKRDIERLSRYAESDLTDRQIKKNQTAVMGSIGAGLLGVSAGIAAVTLTIGAAANPLAALPISIMAYFVVANIVSYTAANLVEGMKILTETQLAYTQATDQQNANLTDDHVDENDQQQSVAAVEPDREQSQQGDGDRVQQQRLSTGFRYWFSLINEQGRFPEPSRP